MHNIHMSCITDLTLALSVLVIVLLFSPQLLFVPDCSPPPLSAQGEVDVEQPVSAPPRLANFDKHYSSDQTPSSVVEMGLEEDEVCDDHICMTAKFITEYEVKYM